MRQAISLGPSELLVQASWGGWLVVPTFNIDVAIGVVRDGLIEPWTTRLVQECLRPGDAYFNAGGNFGYYVALGGQIVGSSGHVITAEPNPHIVPFLLKTVFWSGIIDRTDVFKCALWQKSGEALAFKFDPQYLGGGGATFLFPDRGAKSYNFDSNIADACWNARNVHLVFGEDLKFDKLQGLDCSFTAASKTIDELVAGQKVDLLHLDIEGAEPFALQGAENTIRVNPELKLITEWASYNFQHGSDDLKAAFEYVFGLLRVRHLESRTAEDGGIFLSDYLDFDHLTTKAVHGDYFWTK